MGSNNNDKPPVRTEVQNIRDRLATMKTSLLDTAFTPLYLAKNYGMDILGFNLLDRQMDKSIDQFHSPKARAKILKDNVAGIKTSFLNDPIKKANQSITTHLVNTLTRTTTGFESLLQAPDPVPGQPKRALLTEIQTSLARSRGLNEELDLFKLRMEALEELLAGNRVDNPRVITAYVKEQFDKMLKQLKLKKTADLALVHDQMHVLRLRNQADRHLEDHEIANLEAKLKKDIEESYEKAEQGLEKDFKVGIPADKKTEGDTGTKSLFSQLDTAVTQAEAELTNFVLFAEKSKSKTLLESELIAGLGVGADSLGRKYREVSFLDYAQSIPERDHSWISPTAWFQYAQFLGNNSGELRTPSGLRITCQGNNIAFAFPTSWSPYHHYQDRLLGADMMIMVKDILSRGCSEITLTLECDNPALRKKIMEEFYYCAHLNGFPDDKIKFRIGPCSRGATEEEKKPIENKTASEIMGQLSRAASRARTKKSQWDQEQAALDKDSKIEQTRAVQALDERIDTIIGQDEPAIDAVARFI